MAGVKDVFGTTAEFGASWILDGAVISIEGKNKAGVQVGTDLIVNSATIQYNRPVNKILPLNSAKQYLVAGRGAGTITLGMIVGPSKGIQTFIEKFSDPCEVDGNTMTLKASGTKLCADGEAVEFVANYCLLQGINTSVQSGDMAIVGAGMTLIIGALSLTTTPKKALT
jgi:hypothetical protein